MADFTVSTAIDTFMQSASQVAAAGNLGFVTTAAQTYTLPTTSATLARTDAAQSFTGVQTILGTATLTFGATAQATIGVSADTTAGRLTFTAPSAGFFSFVGGSTAVASSTFFANTGTNTATSGSNVFASFAPTYNQASGTAANTDLLINRTQTLVGSGAQLLADFQVGGTSRNKWDNNGVYTQTTNARSSGVASYFTVTAPADTGITTATESIGINFVPATRTWVDGTVPLQEEYFFGAPTYNKTTTSATFTLATSASFGPPVAGAGVTFTNTAAVLLRGTGRLYFGATGLANIGLTTDATSSDLVFTGTTTGAFSFVNKSKFLAGSAVAPGIVLNGGSANTGLYYIATDSLGISTAGTLAATFDNSQNVLLAKKITSYNGIATAGMGVAPLYAAPAISATKTANFTAYTYTPPATAGQYRVNGVITTTSATNTGTVQFTVDYVDSQGTTHTADVIPICDAAGSIATTKTGASKEYHMVPWMLTINNAATAIVVKVVITGSVSYTVAASCEQVA